jgi:hypothetical protein
MPGEGTYNDPNDTLSGLDLKVDQALGEGARPRRGDLDKFRRLWAEMGWDPNMVTPELIARLRADGGTSPQGDLGLEGEILEDDSLGLEVGPAEVSAQADSSSALEEMVKRLISNGAASPRSLGPR